jgi:hypothetical protein
MRPKSSIIGTSSVNSDVPTPTLLPYDVTQAGIANMTAALAQLLADRGVRANSVAPRGRSGLRLSRPPCPRNT